MDFSVYIIQDRNIDNKTLFKKLAGDVDLKEHAATAAINAASNLIGVDIYDRYADPAKIGETGIAITGKMIESVQIKKELIKREVFNSGVFNRTVYNTLDSSLVTTITVKGTLFAPEFSQTAAKATRLKSMARVMAWASLAPTYSSEVEDGYKGDITTKEAKGESLLLSAGIQKKMKAEYNDSYLRRVIVTVYSVDDQQFRAVLHDKVFVKSYEENYTDKDGNGTFTLVMQSKAASIFDVFVAGPTFKFSYLAMMDQVSTTAGKVANETHTAFKTVTKKMGVEDNEVVQKIDKGLTGAEDASKLPNVLADSDTYSVDKATEITDHVMDTYVNDSVQSALDDANEYQEAYDKLTDEQKKTLANVPGYDKMSLEDKMKYIDKLKK
ncbi:MAG: hypothetical protein IJ685_01635 [Selenomonadaceae bacterium]|nr:hypothetical protein [Selenomonadaceae bacterium]